MNLRTHLATSIGVTLGLFCSSSALAEGAAEPLTVEVWSPESVKVSQMPTPAPGASLFARGLFPLCDSPCRLRINFDDGDHLFVEPKGAAPDGQIVSLKGKTGPWVLRARPSNAPSRVIVWSTGLTGVTALVTGLITLGVGVFDDPGRDAERRQADKNAIGVGAAILGSGGVLIATTLIVAEATETKVSLEPKKTTLAPLLQTHTASGHDIAVVVGVSGKF